MGDINSYLKRLQGQIGDNRRSGDFTDLPIQNDVHPIKPPDNAPCSPDCPICGGWGWYRKDLPITDPMFGRLHACPNADPVKMYGGKTGLEPDELSFDWSRIAEYSNVHQAVSAVKETLEQGYGWVYLWGEYGLAKTLILKVIVAATIRTGKAAAYTRMAEIIDDMRSAFDKDNPSEASQKKIDWWSDIPVLCIDEFDRVRTTEFSAERRFVLMDRRYESATRRKTVTIMTANSDPRKLGLNPFESENDPKRKSFNDGYLIDRIFDGRFKVIQLTGKSARPIMSY